MFDLLTIGRISVDVYGQEEGAGLQDNQTFSKAVGGSPTNVAIGTARYGHKVGVITGVGNDSLGTYALGELRKFGVATDFVTQISGRTPIVIAGLKSPDDPELIFYRDFDAPDTQMEVSAEMLQATASAKFFWYTGSTLANPKLRDTVLTLLSARAGVKSAENFFDLDYRPSFWVDELTAHQFISKALEFADVVIGNRKECAVATGLGIDSALSDFATALLNSGARLAIIKDGANGVLVADSEKTTMIPGIKIKVRCGLGAGDAFGAGLVHGLLQGWSAEASVEFANAAGAHVATQLLCSDAMPDEAQVRSLMSKR